MNGGGKNPKVLIYPVFLEAGNFQTNRNTDYWLFGALLVLTLRNIFVLVRRNSDPTLHPSCKCLSKLGSVVAIVTNIDIEVSKVEGISGKLWVIVTDS
jgi:surface polysaccharide O-acyltransferase-like enzyme